MHMPTSLHTHKQARDIVKDEKKNKGKIIPSELIMGCLYLCIYICVLFKNNIPFKNAGIFLQKKTLKISMI